MGLIRPRRSADNGYREFDAATLTRLHRIQLLRAIGLPLQEIGRLLEGGVADWAAALALQEEWLQGNLDAKRAALGRVQAARDALAAGCVLSVEQVLDLIADADQRTPDGERKMKKLYEKHYSPAARRALERHPATAAEINSGEQEWGDVMAEAERLKDTDPAAPAAQALVGRWDELIQAFTRGNPGVEKGLAALWADRGNWPEEMRHRTRAAVDPAVHRFLEAARQVSRLAKT